MWNTFRRRVAHKNQVCCWKVKVTLISQSHNTLYCNGGRVCSVHMSFLGGFSNNLAEQKCQTHEYHLSRTGPRSVARRSRSHLEVKVIIPGTALVVLSAQYLFNFLRDFQIILQKCQTHKDNVSQRRPNSVAWRSRSNLKVKLEGQSLNSM
jgi:hypothetical protein